MTKRPLERDVQKAIVDALTLAGLTVHETSAWKQKGPSGVDKGIPDLLVFVPEMPWLYVGIEVKRDGKAPRSKEQKEARERCEYEIVWTPEDALQHVLEVIDGYTDEVETTSSKIMAILKILRGAA